MAFQLCSAQSCFSSTKFSATNRNGVVYASADNLSRRLTLFQLTTVLSQPQLLSANAKFLKIEGNDLETVAPVVVDLAQGQGATLLSEETSVSEWTKTDNRRLLHVVYRVGNLDRTIKFYTECLGMKVLRQRDIPEEGYSNAFVGYGPEVSNFAMELTYNYGVDHYDVGTGFGHFGIAVENVPKLVDLVKLKGARVTGQPGLAKGGNAVTASIEDPDGYTCKLIESKPTAEPLSQLMLRVGDLDRSVDFYKKAYGMELLRKTDDPENSCTTATMGYGPEGKSAVLELTYNYGIREYNKGNGYGQIAIGTDDVYKTAEAIRSCGGEIVLEPGPLPGINTKITICLDPDGWKAVFVDNIDFLKELA